MADYSVLQNNFISGEIDPMLEGRLDSVKYQTGLRLCQNVLPTIYGALVKRPGTRYLASIGSLITKARIVLFDGGDDNRYIVEFTNNKLRFFAMDGSLVLHLGATYEIATTYTDVQLDELSCVMNKGVLYIVHPSHKPAKLEKTSTPPFTLTELTFTGGMTFSAAGDYPSTQAFKGGRWYLAGTTNNPNTIYASRSPDETGDRFLNFTFSELIDSVETVLPDHAFFLQETDMHGSRINWMINQKRIIVGAGRSIWMDSGEMATPSTFDMSVTLNTGASKVRPQAYQGFVIYAGTGGKTLNIIQYSQDSGGYVGTELSMTARHLLTAGIKEFVVTETQIGAVIWVLLENGSLLSCSLDIGNSVIGWARHPLGYGQDQNEMVVQSIDVVPGSEDEYDKLLLVVKRSGALFLESLSISIPDTLLQDSASPAYIDCHSYHYNASGTDSLNVPYLGGETVDAIADQAVLPVRVVSPSGDVTYDRTFMRINIGFPIEAKLTILRPELPSNGTSIGKRRQYLSVALRIHKTLGGELQIEGRTIPILSLTPGEYEYGTTLELVTGDIKAEVSSSVDYEGSVTLVSEEPLPFNLLAIITKYGLVEV